MYRRKYGVATAAGTHIVIPIVKAGVNDFAVSADWTPVAGDVKITKDDGAPANIATLPTYIANNGWRFVLSATELQAKKVEILVTDAATKAVEDQFLAVETFGHASALYVQDIAAAEYQSDVAKIKGTDTAATDITQIRHRLNLDGTQAAPTAGGAAKMAGTDAHLTLERLTVASTTANTSAVNFTGNGTGSGMSSVGGAAGGNGIRALGGAGGAGNGIFAGGNANGHGIEASGGLTGDGINAHSGSTTGSGIRAKCDNNSGHGFHASAFAGGAATGDGIRGESGGGATGSGIHAESKSTNGDGMKSIGKGTGSGIISTGGATSGHGIRAVGTGTGDGILAESGTGATGSGIKAESKATNGSGINSVGTGANAGILSTGGVTGDGIKSVGGATSGNGITSQATAGNGHGLTASGNGTGSDINAKELPASFKKNVAFNDFPLVMVLASDHISPATGLAPAVSISKDGGAFVAATNTPATEVANGLYKINLTQAEMNADSISVRGVAGTADDRLVSFPTS